MNKCPYCSTAFKSVYHPEKCPFEVNTQAVSPAIVHVNTLKMTKILDSFWNKYESIPQTIDLNKHYDV